MPTIEAEAKATRKQALEANAQQFDELLEAIRETPHGTITLVMHEGRITTIEQLKKRRFYPAK